MNSLAILSNTQKAIHSTRHGFALGSSCDALRLFNDELTSQRRRAMSILPPTLKMLLFRYKINLHFLALRSAEKLDAIST